MLKKAFVILFLSILLASCQPAGSGLLEIREAWARPAAKGDNSAAYFVVENDTGKDDFLLSASADIAGAVELHMSMMEGDQMQMKMQHEIAIPAGATEFKPGGLHVMFVGLNRDLKTGDSFTLTLKFRNAGEQVVTVAVKEQ